MEIRIGITASIGSKNEEIKVKIDKKDIEPVSSDNGNYNKIYSANKLYYILYIKVSRTCKEITKLKFINRPIRTLVPAIRRRKVATKEDGSSCGIEII